MKDLSDMLQSTKIASQQIALLSSARRNRLLSSLARELKKNREHILAANRGDILRTEKQKYSSAFIDRLTLTEKGFAAMVDQISVVAKLDDPLGEIIEQKKLPNGILLQKKRFPLGVIFVIYESRPNLTIDIPLLCLKSGNAVILKGGNEAAQTNRMLIQCVHRVLSRFSIAKEAVLFLDGATHEIVKEMVTRSDIIDVVIPRGSYALTSMVAKSSQIPVLYHAAGGARMYVDKSADIKMALTICINAKTNRTGVCNALDCVVVHRDIAEQFLPKLEADLIQKHVQIRADSYAKTYMSTAQLAAAKDFTAEFLDAILAVKVVESVPEAIQFISQRTHHHTEIVVATDTAIINHFIAKIDAAGIMINCSSRLHDGSEFSIGAEMGTATGKLHARGPVGIKELTTYKWIAYGSGQIKQ